MTDRIIVKLKSRNSFFDKIEKIEQEGLEFIKDCKVLNLLVFNIKSDKDISEVVQHLLSLDFVKNAEEDVKVKVNQNYPENFDDNLWNMEECRFPYAWETDTGSLNTSIAILDNGVDANHEALSHAVNVDKSFDFVEYEEGISSYDDHGTHVAGTTTGYESGFVGANWTAEVVGVRVLDSDGEGYLSDVIEGIEYAAGLHAFSPSGYRADVINMSLGAENDYSDLEDAVKDARNEGCIIVAAAGNDANTPGYTGGLNYPAAYEEVISVGALDEGEPPTRASYSNYDEDLDLTAPGSSIKSTLPYNNYGYMSGTSMASPLVSGLVALMINNGINHEKVRDILARTVIDLGDKQYYGHGMINANWAVDNINYVHIGLGEVINNEPELDYHRSYPITKNTFSLETIIPGEYEFIIWVDSYRDNKISSGDSYLNMNIQLEEDDHLQLDGLEVLEV